MTVPLPRERTMHDLPLAHYAAEPINGPLRFVAQNASPEGFFCYSKPRGLWVSVDDGYGWREWCEGEHFALERLAAVHIVTLATGCNILWLRSPGEIEAFAQQYGTPDPISHSTAIPWPTVADDYDGIIIAPYQWTLRLDVPWYYSWDCSSGCIWNPAAIADVRLEQVAA